MGNKYSKKWIYFISLLSFIIIFTYTHEGVLSANNWVYNIHGDSLKNYFNVIFSAKNSESLWLNHVNYPYGEQLFYLDAQVFLTKTIQFFSMQNYTIALINLLPLLLLAITPIPIFLIQRKLNTPLFINVVASILIAFLSPQLNRFTGHFALSYTIFIPLLLLLILNEFKNTEWKYFLILLWVVVFSFIHPYYLLIAVIILFSFIPFHLFIRKNLKELIYNTLVVLLPLLAIKLTLIFTDNITDRPDFPFGIWEYRSTFASVFNPKFKPFAELITDPLNLKFGTFEGNAYVGILGFPVLVFTIIRVLKRVLFKKKISEIFINTKFTYLFFISFSIWIFALYYPLKFVIDPALELIPVLKQFRSLGRFGWIFYYTFSIFITINLSLIYQYIKRKKNQTFAFFVVLLFLSLWFIDANANMNTLKDAISKRITLNIHNSKNLNKKELEKLKTEFKVDVILSLPVFHVGSEIENYEGSSISILETFIISNILSIPYFSTYSSRVSTSQFIKAKTLKKTGNLDELFSNSETILIIADKNKLNKAESTILENSIIIYNKEQLVYAIIKR